MLCIQLLPYSEGCKRTSGGVSRIWLFDREDFNFTQAAPVNGVAQPYTAIALRAGATGDAGGNMFPVLFTKDEAEYSYTQSRKGTSVKYAHKVELSLGDLSQLITNWNEAIDNAGACCGFGMIIELQSGKKFVLGEKWVNADSIPQWLFAQDGGTGTTGKLIDDENLHTAILLGDYSRPAYEYTGVTSAIVALEPAAAS